MGGLLQSEQFLLTFVPQNLSRESLYSADEIIPSPIVKAGVKKAIDAEMQRGSGGPMTERMLVRIFRSRSGGLRYARQMQSCPDPVLPLPFAGRFSRVKGVSSR